MKSFLSGNISLTNYSKDSKFFNETNKKSSFQNER